MDAPGNGVPPSPEPEPERSEDDAAARLLSLLGLRVDEVRALAGEVTSRWRGDALRVGEGSRRKVGDLFRELGLVTRDDWDELELRVAQLEHRLRLLEDRK